MEQLYAAVADPEYPEKLEPDEGKFLDSARSMVTVGWEEVYVVDGEVVNITQENLSTS
jgi:hypothetical protein